MNLENYIKIKEYDRFILYKHVKTGYKECFLKVEVNPPKSLKRKWER